MTLVVVDPAAFKPEPESFNLIASQYGHLTHYHAPGLVGTKSIVSAGYRAHRLSGIVILGSAISVHDRLPWQIELGDWLVPLMLEGVPTLGICFGHQLIADLTGGSVGYVRPDREKLKGYRALSLGTKFGLGAGGRGECFVSHREQVKSLGANMVPACEPAQDGFDFDVVRHQRLPIWGFQAHIESTPDFVRDHDVVFSPGDEERLIFGQSLLRQFLLLCRQRYQAQLA